MRQTLFGALLALAVLAGARPATARVPASRPTPLATLQAKIEQLNRQLASLSSYHAQVKDLQIRVIHITQVLDRLARAAEAPKTLATELDKVRQQIAALTQRIERVRLDRLRVAYEKAELRSTGGINAGYDEGFFIASRSGRYRFGVNAIFRFAARGGQITGTTELRPPGKIHLLGLNVPHGYLQFSGNVFTKKLTFLLELDFAAEGVSLNDFSLNYRPSPYFAVTAGQFLVSFSKQQVFDPYDTMFVDATPAALFFGPGRGIGLKLHFYQWEDRIFQELGVFNGAGINSGGNDDTNFMYVARLGIMPLGPMPEKEGDLRTGARPLRFRIAAGYLFQPMPAGRDLDGKDGMDSIFMHQIAAELALVAKGFSLNGEFFYRLENHGKAVTELPVAEKQRRPFFGGYAQAAYTFRRVWLQPAVRYSYAEPVGWWRAKAGAMDYGWSSPVGGAEEPGVDGPVALRPESVHSMTAGLNWYGFDQHVKVIVNYTYLWERGYRLSTGSGSRSRQVHLGSLLIQGRF